MDPAWGGVYQYSTDGDWDHPHFEKLIQFQAELIRIYSMADMQFHDMHYCLAAHRIQEYTRKFLTSRDGAFYVSQNADLIDGEHAAGYFALGNADRLKHGIPRVDTHCYARENGWAIRGLLAVYADRDAKYYLKSAIRAADWIIANRSLPGGGFSHDAKDPAGPYLGDTLAMGRAFLALYESTADRAWLVRAERGILSSIIFKPGMAWRQLPPGLGRQIPGPSPRSTKTWRQPDFSTCLDIIPAMLRISRLPKRPCDFSPRRKWRDPATSDWRASSWPMRKSRPSQFTSPSSRPKAMKPRENSSCRRSELQLDIAGSNGGTDRKGHCPMPMWIIPKGLKLRRLFARVVLVRRQLWIR